MSVFSEKQAIQEELETCLEKFLDILAEVEKMERLPATNFPDSCPEGLAGEGFAITFPFHQAVGLLLMAHREDLLPNWYRHPGIAGKSRLFLFANHLSHFFSLESEENNRTFFDSANYFAGSVRSLEKIFKNLPFSSESAILPFQLRRWDGQSTTAWLMGPFSHVNIESTVPPLSQVTRHVHALKPVRKLEGSETSLFYAPFSEELEEILQSPSTEEEEMACPEREENPVETPPPQEEVSGLWEEAIQEIRLLAPFPPAWRFRHFPTLRHQRREEQILVRVRYAHPAHTQIWRKRVNAVWETLLADFSQSLAKKEWMAEEVWEETTLPLEMFSEMGKWEYCTPHYSPRCVTAVVAAPPEKMPEMPPRLAKPRPRIEEENVMRIPVTFSVVVARRKIPLQTFLQLRPGDILNFNQKIDAPMEIFVGHQKRGKGMPVEYEGRVGIQILEEEPRS